MERKRIAFDSAGVSMNDMTSPDRSVLDGAA
jgi:hypothetical protein